MKLLEQSQIRRISDVLPDEPGTLVKSTNPLEISSDVIRVLRRISTARTVPHILAVPVYTSPPLPPFALVHLEELDSTISLSERRVYVASEYWVGLYCQNQAASYWCHRLEWKPGAYTT